MNTAAVGITGSALPELNSSICVRFKTVLAGLPVGQIAYQGSDGSLTYQELDQRSDQLANVLIERLGRAAPGAQVAVGLLLPHESSSLVGVLGVLKTGHFYVPLDPHQGEGYLRQILDDCPPKVLVTTTALLELGHRLAAPYQAVPSLSIDNLPSCSPPAPGEMAISYQTYACIQYTSGTTGKPRGVIRVHGQILASIDRSAHDDMERRGPADRVAHLLSFAYAFSTAQIFGGLLSGATLYAYSDLTPEDLYLKLRQDEITMLTVAPGMLRRLADLAGQRPPLEKMRIVTTGAEPISHADVDRLTRLLPVGCQLVFRLGATEASTYAHFIIRAGQPWEGARTPAGYPPDQTEVFILDEAGQPVAPNTPGQICVRSRFLSAGYWNRPAETAAKFLPDPEGGDRRIFLTGDLGRISPDGLIEHLGRMDFMVKIRGYRVEPEVIAAALRTHENIRECEVLACPNRVGELRLVAYLAPRELPGPTASELRELVSATLPVYMVPARFVILESLPRNPNGKVDRNALPQPDRARPDLSAAFVFPQSELEAQIALLWAELLELDEVGREDNFFELGGDSLSALSMIAQVQKITGQNVALDYFRTPTIAALARLCEPGSASTPPASTSPSVRPKTAPGLSHHPVVRLLTGQTSANAMLRWAIQSHVLRLSYEQGLRWLAWMGQPRIANRLFGDERELFLGLAQDLDNPAAATQEAFRASVLGNNVWSCYQRRWRKGQRPRSAEFEALQHAPDLFWRSFADRMDHAPKAERGRFINFSGLEYLYHAKKSDRGAILLTYHSPATPIASAILSHVTNLGRIPTISLFTSAQMAERDRLDSEELPEDDSSFDSRKLVWSAILTLQGQRHLKQNGVVQMVSDVSYGEGSFFRKTIGKRSYDLKPGFAELALSTGAAVLPVYSRFDGAGRIHMTFLPELKPLAGSKNHTACVQDMLDQYTEFLENTWRKMPESVGWGALRRYASRPLSDTTFTRPAA